jgi:hypothetical protein
MKKIFIALVTLTLVFGLSAVAFATDDTQTTYQGKNQKHMGELRITPPAIGTLTPQAIRTMKTTPPAFGLNQQAKTTLAALRADINTNREEINAARLLVKEELTLIKQEIKVLRDSEIGLTEEQMATIRTRLQATKTDRETYNIEHKKIMVLHKAAIQKAHGTKDLTIAVVAMQKIIAEQELRIKDLGYIHDNLVLLLEDLKVRKI